MSTYSFYAGTRFGECAPSGQSIEDFFGCQDVAAAVYFCPLFDGPGQRCWVHDDSIDGDCNPEDWEISDADRERAALMTAIEWQVGTESVGFRATVNGEDLRVRQDHGPTAGDTWLATVGKGRMWARTRFEAMARAAAVAYPMTQVEAVASALTRPRSYAPGELDRMEAEDRVFWRHQRALREQGIETGNLATLSSPWTGVSAETRAEADSAWLEATSAARRRF